MVSNVDAEECVSALTAHSYKIDVSHEDAKWHGLIGCSKGLNKPVILAKSSEKARPGYTDIDASEYGEASEKDMKAKIELIAELVRSSKTMILFTGAGISTNSGIKDYATKAKDSTTKLTKKTAGRGKEPTIAHKILTRMYKVGYVKRWFQQNHDALAQKAGYPQLAINEIHGSNFNPANPVIKMAGTLREDLIEDGEEWSEKADFVLVLGTSLSGMMVEFLVTNNTDRFVAGLGLGAALVNLQRTEHDDKMSVRIWSDVDKAMLMLEEALGLESYKTLPTDLDWMHLETVELRDNVFVIPYDKNGMLSQSKRIELDMNVGAKIVIMQGRDTGTKGEVVGRNGYHFRMKMNYTPKSKKAERCNPAPKKPAFRTFGA